MKKLSKEEMKKVIGGVYGGDPGGGASSICNGNGDRVAYCYNDHGACLPQGYGYCPAGSESYCDMYCVRPDGSTYWPGNC